MSAQHDRDTRLEALVELGKANERARQAARTEAASRVLKAWSREIVEDCNPYITFDDIHHFLLEEPLFLRLFGRYDLRKTEAADWIMTDTKTQRRKHAPAITVGRIADFVYECEKAEQEQETEQEPVYKY